MLDDGLADVWTKAVDEVEHATGETDALHHHGEVVGRERCKLGRFCHDGVAHQQGRGHFP